jgi:hypothetical protein
LIRETEAVVVAQAARVADKAIVKLLLNSSALSENFDLVILDLCVHFKLATALHHLEPDVLEDLSDETECCSE